ncbi:MAG: KOW motif-containing protein, partial [Syntrophothermus sp.]
IRGDEKDRLESLQQDAIIRCLFENGRPAKIPDWQIESLRLMLDSQSDFYVKNGLVPGQKVKINDGPFKGVIGVIQDSENEKTIAVSVDLLKRSILAHLPKDSKFEIIKD